MDRKVKGTLVPASKVRPVVVDEPGGVWGAVPSGSKHRKATRVQEG